MPPQSLADRNSSMKLKNLLKVKEVVLPDSPSMIKEDDSFVLIDGAEIPHFSSNADPQVFVSDLDMSQRSDAHNRQRRPTEAKKNGAEESKQPQLLRPSLSFQQSANANDWINQEEPANA